MENRDAEAQEKIPYTALNREATTVLCGLALIKLGPAVGRDLDPRLRVGSGNSLDECQCIASTIYHTMMLHVQYSRGFLQLGRRLEVQACFAARSSDYASLNLPETSTMPRICPA